MTARELRKWLIAIVGVTSSLGLLVEITHPSDLIREKLSLSYEGNVPTWVSTLLLFSCAIVAGSIAQRAIAFRRHWWGVAAVFAYASLDEAAELHEHMGGTFDLGGIFYFDWVIFAAILLLALAIVFFPFVRKLEPKTRRRLIVAGIVYIGGAVVMELPLGWWTEKQGPDSLGYSLIDWVEETMEMIGASMALLALLRHREGE